MRRIKLFEEFIQAMVAPNKRKIDVTKRIAIVPNWKVY